MRSEGYPRVAHRDCGVFAHVVPPGSNGTRFFSAHPLALRVKTQRLVPSQTPCLEEADRPLANAYTRYRVSLSVQPRARASVLPALRNTKKEPPQMSQYPATAGTTPPRDGPLAPAMGTFAQAAHPWARERRPLAPAQTSDEHVGLNGKIALALTSGVGTMWCAYAFAALALIALPQALQSGLFPTVQWISQTFIQLVMLSVIMVGQNILSRASDKRAIQTYMDAEAILHENITLKAESIVLKQLTLQQNEVLAQQSAMLVQQSERVMGLEDTLTRIVAHLHISASDDAPPAAAPA